MASSHKKILIVEDNKGLAKVLSSALHSEDASILEAGNGEDGLALALKEHPDLILLDVVMPKMDGITMLQKMREDEWGKNASVIILSNLSDQNRVADAVTEGVFDYLIKDDWSLDDLITRVKAKLNI